MSLSQEVNNGTMLNLFWVFFCFTYKIFSRAWGVAAACASCSGIQPSTFFLFFTFSTKTMDAKALRKPVWGILRT
jgi:hypothetical protein